MKGLKESEGFMNALSSQAARMKEKRVKKVSKASLVSESGSVCGPGWLTTVKKRGGGGGPFVERERERGSVKMWGRGK